MSYSVQNIRNVCLLGHSGSGKTSLAENLLFMTGAIERQGRVADGNTVCDYDPEEVKRQISLSTAVAPIDYKGCRINVLDTPGAFDFSGEVMEALRAAGRLPCGEPEGCSVRWLLSPCGLLRNCFQDGGAAGLQGRSAGGQPLPDGACGRAEGHRA